MLIEDSLDLARSAVCTSTHTGDSYSSSDGSRVDDFILAEIDGNVNDSASAVAEEYQVASLTVLVFYSLQLAVLGDLA